MQGELELFNRTIQMLAKLSQTIARESGEANGSTEMNSLLQICFDKLHHIQENLPVVLKRNKILLGYLQKLDDGLSSWLNDAEQLLGEHAIQVSVQRINESLEQHRVSVVDIHRYPMPFFSFNRTSSPPSITIERCSTEKRK